MQNILFVLVFVLACLACAGHGRRVHAPLEKLRGRQSAKRERPKAVQANEHGLVKETSNRSTSLATLLRALNPETAAFNPASPGMPVLHSSRSAAVKALPEALGSRRSSTPWMVAAKDVFHQKYTEASMLQRKIVDLPSSVTKVAIPGVVAASVLLGFLATPSKRFPVRAIGAWLLSKLGTKAGSHLATAREEAAIPCIAALLSDGPTDITSEQLEDISLKCGMTLEEIELELPQVYYIFLSACLESEKIETVELSELKKLANFLNMSAAAVGSQVFKAAEQLSSEDLIRKYIFLAERILREDESPEGYEYEAQRAQKELGISRSEWLRISEEAAVPFYERALDTCVIQGKSVKKAQLDAIRESLAISPETAEEMHQEVLSRFFTDTLSTQGKFTEEDKANLESRQALLGTSVVGSDSLLDQTVPMYMKAFTDVINELSGADYEQPCQSKVDKLAQMQLDLLLEPGDVQEAEVSAVLLPAKANLEAANKLLHAGNKQAVHRSVQSLVNLCLRLSDFMILKTGTSESLDDVLTTFFGGIGEDMLTQDEVESLYRAMVAEFTKDRSISEEDKLCLSRFGTMLGLSEFNARPIYTGMVGPIMRQALDKILESGTAAKQKNEIQELVTGMGLTEDFTKNTILTAYKKKMWSYAGDDAMITTKQASSLEKLRDVLGIDMETVAPAHEEKFGATYGKAVRDVLETEGEIPQKSFENLEELQSRLGITERTAKDLFGIIFTAQAKTFAEKALTSLQYELGAEEANEEAKELGDLDEDAKPEDSPNYDKELRNFAPFVLDMVDYADRCNAFVVKEVDGEIVNECGASLKGEMKLEDSQQVYTQYLKHVYQTSNETLYNKLFRNLEKVALVLGLEYDTIRAVHDDVGETIYESYMAKALDKGRLDSEDMQFLEEVKEDLGLEETMHARTIRQQEFKRVKGVFDAMVQKEDYNSSEVEQLLDQAELFEVDLKDDLNVEQRELDEMYEVHMEDLVAAGVLSRDDLSPLSEMCEQLHLDEAKAMEMFTEYVIDSIDGYVLQANSMMAAQSPEDAVLDLLEVIKFAKVLDVKASAPVPQAQKSQLYMLFTGYPPQDGADGEERILQEELLKGVLDLEGVVA